ncbi:hypothetical protein ACSQ67_024422 [Phaseolus vulgaris]
MSHKLWSMHSSLKLFGTTLGRGNSGNGLNIHRELELGLIPSMSIYSKPISFLGRRTFGKCFTLLMLPYKNISDTVLGTMKLILLGLEEQLIGSLQAFKHFGLAYRLVLIGDFSAANSSHREFFHVWKRYGVLPERCKYLYLLFDDSFVHENNYVFTTEGHPFPVLSNWHEELPQAYVPTNWTFVKVFLQFTEVLV